MFNLFLKLVWLWVIIGTVYSLDYAKFETRSRVKVSSDGGYTDLVVAIGTNVEEDPELLESVKEVVTSFSRYLHQLTGLYVKTAGILVPGSWQPKPDSYEPASWETFENSDLRVDYIGANDEESQRICAHAPFTLKPSQCGSPGRYIVVTPDFIQESDIADAFGGHEKALIREWAKYRWGIFDESPSESGPHFYASSSGEFEGIRCSKERKGTLETTSGGICRMMPDGLPEENCRFIDDGTMRSAQYASIMYRPFLEGIELFCDSKDEVSQAERIHNIEAPNQQNRQCDRLSAWEVFRSHSDFDYNEQSPWKEPIFSIRQRSVEKVVLVLDKSNSMSLNHRIDILRQAAYNFITRVIPDGAKLGIVEFNEESSINDIRAPLTEINDRTRAELLPLIPSTKVTGQTSIGAGVRRGICVLEDGVNGSPAGGQMIVISDGKETNQPYIGRILSEDRNKISTITIHTVAVGPEVDEDLELLATFTGGKHYHHSDFSTTLFDVFSQFGFDTLRKSSEIFSQSARLRPQHSSSYEVLVDPSVVGDILFLVGANSTESLIVSVRSPDGRDYDAPNSVSAERDDFQLISIKPNNAMPGIWTLTITNLDTRGKQINIVVDGTISTSSPPISLDAQWGLDSMTPPDVQALYVAVTKGYIPVIGANVKAFVTLSESQVLQILYDDGVGADVKANDGVYSAFFTRLQGSGRYGAKVLVEGVNGRTKVLSSECLADSSPESDARKPRSADMDIETGAFQRVVDAGSFKCVSGVDCEGMSIPSRYGPAKVTDLRIENIDLANYTADLVFTSPGDDLMDGQAFRYNVRYSRSFDELHTMYTTVPVIGDSASTDKVYFSNTIRNPQQARQRESFRFILPQEKGVFSYVFALTATDNNGNISPVSNFASMPAKYLGSPFISLVPPSPDPSTKVAPGDQDTNTDNSGNKPFPWYFILVALIALVIFLLFLIIVWKARNSKHDNNLIPPSRNINRTENSFSNPALHATSSNSVRYASSASNVPSDYQFAIASDPYSAEVGFAKNTEKDYDIAPPPPPPSYDSHLFVSISPTSPYSISASQIKHSSDLDDSNHYEDTSQKRTASYSRDNIRHSGIVTSPHTGDGYKKQASLVASDWRKSGGSNVNMRGVQPQSDVLGEASIKSRGDKAIHVKLQR